MVFSSAIFLFAFLPAFLCVYYATPLRWRSAVLLAASYVFYAWWRIDFAFLFFGVTLWNYCIYRRMVAGDAAKRWMQVGVAGNLVVLGIFKYAGFGVDALNDALAGLGMQPFAALHILLPIGISFYVFQSISFLIDIYRKDAPHPRHFFDFAAFVSFFPHLVAGPILRYKDVAAQFAHREHNFDHFSEGAYRFMIGFAQKILIADSIAPLADAMFALDNPGMVESWLGALAYTLQLYFDFLGYSSMAIGLGLMMGFRITENFNHPYAARSITDFWRRWHMSLSAWLRDYLYIPLGGNRDGAARTYRNLGLTMLLGGLWHGANWTFALWGAWHALFLCLERALRIQSLGLVATGLVVMVGWVMFRADDLGHALTMYQGMIGLNGVGPGSEAAWQITRQSMAFLVVGLALLYIHPRFLEFRRVIPGSPAMKTDGYRKPLVACATCVLFIAAVARLLASSYSPFLYFQF